MSNEKAKWVLVIAENLEGEVNAAMNLEPLLNSGYRGYYVHHGVSMKAMPFKFDAVIMSTGDHGPWFESQVRPQLNPGAAIIALGKGRRTPKRDTKKPRR